MTTTLAVRRWATIVAAVVISWIVSTVIMLDFALAGVVRGRPWATAAARVKDWSS